MMRQDAASQVRWANFTGVQSLGKAALDFGRGVGEGHFGMTLFPSSSQMLSASQEGPYLILDTRATDHVFPRRDQFHSYDSNVPLSCSFVKTADNRQQRI